MNMFTSHHDHIFFFFYMNFFKLSLLYRMLKSHVFEEHCVSKKFVMHFHTVKVNILHSLFLLRLYRLDENYVLETSERRYLSSPNWRIITSSHDH